VVAAHYCCELGEAALAAKDFEAARAHLAAARVHAAQAARVQMLAARLAAATDDPKALELYTVALSGSRAVRDAFLPEAHATLGAAAAELDRQLLERQPPDDQPPPVSARFRCDQCGVASVTWHWRCPSCRSWDSLQSLGNREA
jgi:lipopolysaccharide biosynthesis regulator YciM